MRLTEKLNEDLPIYFAKDGKDEDETNTKSIIQKLGQLEDIEDNLPAFNGLQHLFAVIDLMEQDEGLCFTYKGKSFVIERNE